MDMVEVKAQPLEEVDRLALVDLWEAAYWLGEGYPKGPR